jgi:hypothetical protein
LWLNYSECLNEEGILNLEFAPSKSYDLELTGGGEWEGSEAILVV